MASHPPGLPLRYRIEKSRQQAALQLNLRSSMHTVDASVNTLLILRAVSIDPWRCQRRCCAVRRRATGTAS
jgi:hypothetical protein